MVNALGTIQRLDAWYKSQCNGDWEHTYGIRLSNSDNPGWIMEVDLEYSDLHDKVFEELSEISGESSEFYIVCKVKYSKDRGRIFFGACSAGLLDDLASIFLGWANGKR